MSTAVNAELRGVLNAGLYIHTASRELELLKAGSFRNEARHLGLDQDAMVTTGYSNYHGITTTISKRFNRRWQGTATHTWSMLKDSTGQPYSGFNVVPFKVARDLGGDYSFAITDQRNRAVFNGIVDIGKGFQLSGLYFFGSGMRFVTNWAGPNLRASLRRSGITIAKSSLSASRISPAGLPGRCVGIMMLGLTAAGHTGREASCPHRGVYNRRTYTLMANRKDALWENSSRS